MHAGTGAAEGPHGGDSAMLKNFPLFIDMERLKHAMELCSRLRRAAPECFHLLYESHIHCIYAWETRLRHRATSTMADVAGIFETCGGDEACICRKLMEIAND